MAEPVAGRACHYGTAGEPHVAPFAKGPLPGGVAQGAHKGLVFWAFVAMYQWACAEFDARAGAAAP